MVNRQSTHDLHFLSFSLDAWSPVWLNRHHIMSRMAKQAPVLFVSQRARPRDTIASFFLHHLPRPGRRQIAPNLIELVPPRWLPRFETIPPIERLVQTTEAMMVHRGLRRYAPASRILYLWHPQFEPMVGRFGESLVVFHCYDDYAGMPGLTPGQQARITRAQERLARRADLVFAAGESMRTLIPREDVHVIPNGVDYELFATAHERDTPPPPEMASMPHPIVAHIGRLNVKIDFELLGEIARRRRDWSVVLIGPFAKYIAPELQARLDAFLAHPNAYHIPGKPVVELPRYLRHVDVTLMAYRPIGWVHHISPIKLFEYTATGKPIVATDIEELRRYPEYATLAHTPDEWIAAIEHWLANDSEELARKRMAFAKANSWDVRCRRILELIESKLETSGR